MSIESKELRIGNYIGLQEKPIIVSLTTLERIFTNNVKYLGQYNPIPITEEWLFKLGYFKKEESSTCEWWKHRSKKVSIKYFKNEGVWKYAINRLELKHVHQLQNLYFALTNKELTIK